MRRYSVTSAKTRLLTLLLAIALAIALASGSGCGAPSALQFIPSQLAPVRAPYRPQTTIVYCGDTTASYDRRLLLQANALLANLLDAAVQPNADRLTAYITWLNDNPFDPNATPLVIQIPVQPAQPAPPRLEPTPTPSDDPYTDAQRRQRIEQDNSLTAQAYQRTLAADDARLDQTRRAVRAQTDALRALRPPTAYVTSVYGCLAIASVRLAHVIGAKLLIIASDLANTTLRDYLPASARPLRGVQIRVVFLQCASAPECQATTSYWDAVFRASGARPHDIAFYDPASSRSLSATSLLVPMTPTTPTTPTTP